jgi:hypothetical protein
MTAAITLWESLTKCQTIPSFIMNSSDELPWLPASCHQLLTVGIDKYTIVCPELQASHYTKSLSWVYVVSFKAAGRLSHDIGSVVCTQEPLMNPRLSGKQEDAEHNLHCCHIYPGECRVSFWYPARRLWRLTVMSVPIKPQQTWRTKVVINQYVVCNWWEKRDSQK